jgi:predicted pyridoxine 5'-phosphate oxidase superfamily flavin-nucleotide-binding protein
MFPLKLENLNMISAMSTEAIDFVKKIKLGFVASVFTDGRPHLSHKGTLTVYDDQHLIFADIASPQTVENLRHSAEAVIEVVDFFSRKGFRFVGTAHVVPMTEEAKPYVAFYESWGLQDVKARVKNFVLIKIESVQQTFSPAYSWGATEPELRTRWTSYYHNLWKF